MRVPRIHLESLRTSRRLTVVIVRAWLPGTAGHDVVTPNAHHRHQANPFKTSSAVTTK
jgi:hypothetical protein